MRLVRTVLLLLATALPAAAGLVEEPFEGLVIEYPEGREELAHRVADQFAFYKEQTELHLGRPYDAATRIVLCRNRAELVAAARSDLPEWALAVAIPARGVIGVRLSGIAPFGSDLHSTIVHEMAHLALGRSEAAAGAPLPIWFHEGVAEWTSRSYHPGSTIDLSLEAAMSQLIPLEKLEDSFPEGRDRAALAYVQARAFVDFVVERGGRRSIADILDAFERGQDFDTAFEAATGWSRPDAEAAWREDVTPRFPWLYVLGQTLSLFSALALLVVVAAWLRRRRTREVLERWEEEETRHPPPLVPPDEETPEP